MTETQQKFLKQDLNCPDTSSDMSGSRVSNHDIKDLSPSLHAPAVSVTGLILSSGLCLISLAPTGKRAALPPRGSAQSQG